MYKAVGWEQFTINNRQGLRLSAMLLNVSDHSIVIVCHGFTGSKEGGGRAIEMGEALSELGYSSLLFDFAGCGRSEGAWENITLSGQTDDVGCLVHWCRRSGYRKIILTGRSFGGSTIINYAATDPEISAVCTWSAPARPSLLFEKYLQENLTGPAEDVITIEGEEMLHLKKGFFYDLRQHNLLECAASLAPIKFLVIHGSGDESVPLKEAILLFEAAREPKKMEIINNADHRFTDHIKQVWDVFFKWLQSL
ncbi:MAG: alpha/beta hydrolase [Bacillota bacterium]